jgi:hypothetical protein
MKSSRWLFLAVLVLLVSAFALAGWMTVNDPHCAPLRYDDGRIMTESDQEFLFSTPDAIDTVLAFYRRGLQPAGSAPGEWAFEADGLSQYVFSCYSGGPRRPFPNFGWPTTQTGCVWIGPDTDDATQVHAYFLRSDATNLPCSSLQRRLDKRLSVQ